jgi:hypothetical protein
MHRYTFENKQLPILTHGSDEAEFHFDAWCDPIIRERI